MGLADFVGNVSGAYQDVRGAWSKPRIARERVAKAQSAADQKAQMQSNFEQGLLQDALKATAQAQLAETALPTATKVATTARDIDLGRKRFENELDQDNTRLTGAETRQTAETLGEQSRENIGANAKADVTRMEGWAGVLPPFRENVIRPAQEHELALMDRTFGATAPLELAGQLERERMGLQKEMFDKQVNDPFTRFGNLARIAAAAGSLFF